MRLGAHCFTAETTEELHAILPDLDTYGLSAVTGPARMIEMDIDECAAFGETASALDIVVGEKGMWENLMTKDRDLRARRIAKTRDLLVRADVMDCHCVVSLVGTDSPSDRSLTATPYMFTEECKEEFYTIVHTILEGLDLTRTKYVIEPWYNTFFY